MKMTVHKEELVEKKEDGEDIVLEKIFSKFRPLGPYYLRFMPLLIFACMSNAMYCMNYVFAVVMVEYRCKYPACANSTSWSQLAQNLTQDTCHVYSLTENNGTCSIDSRNVSNYQDCKEWTYEDPLSFVADFDLGCQDWKRALVGTVHSIGYMLGLLILGPISDKIGRKKLIIFTGVTGAVMGLARSVTVSYWTYIAFELVEALLGDIYSPNYMLGVEMVAKENRALFAPLMIGTMSVGGMVMALIAYLIPYWRHFLRVIYGPALLFLFYAFFLDESVRWLLIKGRKKEAKNILRKAAKLSNVYLEESTLDKLACENCEKTNTNVNLITLLTMTFKSKKLLLRFLACACAWVTATFNKYGLLINSVSLEGNKYINYALTSFADLPASVLLVFLLIKFKRKKPLIFSFLMTGSFCIIQSVIPKGYPVLSTSLFFVGKFTSALASGTVYLYTTELFPTYTRNTMHALCSSIGRIGSILAPQTTLLLRYWSGFPSLIVGGLSLLTALVVTVMPDTAEDVLPDTVQQAEALGNQTTKDKSATNPLL
ncbi:organic cation transporter protein-like isoform X2 [Trichoplusia ni]|uniref:Organic cation transporter protein-like isoform X2 n=1 Tax=Trichoplusia ni TaxID=7111 RepID=A0A7E5WY78_TRINI|nr:organic cation transporter protein-like isoform X2 [Trichoplusia ni]